MRYVQVVLTDDHVNWLSEALRDYAPEPEHQEEIGVLETLINTVAAHPESFPVQGQMAKAIKSRVRKIKGPAQPPSRKNKRKVRQETRMRTAKARRIERREMVENFNQARERMEADINESMEIAQERARRREVLASRDDLTNEEVAELFELFDLPAVAKFLRDEHALTPDQRLERAARDREEYGIGIDA